MAESRLEGELINSVFVAVAIDLRSFSTIWAEHILFPSQSSPIAAVEVFFVLREMFESEIIVGTSELGWGKFLAVSIASSNTAGTPTCVD